MIFSQQIINYNCAIFKKISKIFSSNYYSIYFSFFYAIIWTFNFYPGILYSDSVPRWDLAIEIATNGFEHIQNFSSHHPIIPSIFQSLFYNITHELGFYILIQVFLFSFSLFYFIHTFSKSKESNILISFLLLIPVNVIYALFHSFDSMFAISLLLFISVLLRLGEKKFYYILLPILFFCMVSTRLNAIALLIPTSVYILYLYRSKIKTGFFLSTILILFGILPFIIVSSMHMKTSNSWVIGFAWEYANLAIKSSEKSNQEYLLSIGSNIEKIKNNICYNGIWCGAEREEFISKISKDNDKSTEVIKRYIQLAIDEPYLFLNEKIKYTSSLFGFSRIISNSEIARWREKHWAEAHAKLGFHTTKHKEQIIDEYFLFSNKNNYIFKPYLLFLIMFVVTLISFILFSRKFSYAFLIAYIYSLFYYATFIITSQNHEFRYFFPSFFILEGLAVIFVVKLYSKYVFLKNNILYIFIFIFIFISVRHILHGNNYIKDILDDIPKKSLFEINSNSGFKVYLTNENKLIYYKPECKVSDIENTFFLHIFPTNQKDLEVKKRPSNGLDFKWDAFSIEIPIFSSYSGGCLAIRKLPTYAISAIRTGRYKGAERFWQNYIDLKTHVKKINIITAYNLSDKNWKNGISKTKSGFFLENNVINRFSIKQNDTLDFPYSGERKITKVIYSEKYINIYVNGSALNLKEDGYPNTIKIIKREKK